MRILFASILIFTTQLSFSKEWNQVTHLSGTETVAGTKVNVTSDGHVDQMSSYCGLTSTYYVGRNEPVTGDGSYTFQFTPAVNKVKLDISAMSHSEGSYSEIIIIRINGKQYKVPSVEKENGCEPLAIVTEDGNIAPCIGCSGSGVNDIIIDGPIRSIEVKDSVIFGSPEGTLFTLHIGEGMPMGPELISVRAVRVLNVPNDRTHVRAIGIPNGGAELKVYNAKGKLLKTMSQGIKNNQLIYVADLPDGYYVFLMEGDRFREERSVILSAN